MDIVLVAIASLLAGLVDAIVGGGGLILVPSLFAIFPHAAPATLFGTNKSASIWGTSLAAWRYARGTAIVWPPLFPAIILAFAGGLFGAWCVTQLPAEGFRKALPFILLIVFIYTLLKKDLGQYHQPRFFASKEATIAALLGLVMGFYDGFFGPGTGSFLVFLWVRVLGYDFLRASVSAKWINVSTNLAAIILFASKGYVWWYWVPLLAVANMVGSVVGTHLAMKHGSRLVRQVFMVVVFALIVKTIWDAFYFK